MPFAAPSSNPSPTPKEGPESVPPTRHASIIFSLEFQECTKICEQKLTVYVATGCRSILKGNCRGSLGESNAQHSNFSEHTIWQLPQKGGSDKC
eukprot:240330-Pelagomonas_calceolata.AAC.10